MAWEFHGVEEVHTSAGMMAAPVPEARGAGGRGAAAKVARGIARQSELVVWGGSGLTRMEWD